MNLSIQPIKIPVQATFISDNGADGYHSNKADGVENPQDEKAPVVFHLLTWYL
jgi:hypothetical protein